MSKALEMSTALAIVLLGGLSWLKPETNLAEIGSRAKVVDCLGSNYAAVLEGRVPSTSTIQV